MYNRIRQRLVHLYNFLFDWAFHKEFPNSKRVWKRGLLFFGAGSRNFFEIF